MTDLSNFTKITLDGKEYEVGTTLNLIDTFQDKYNISFDEVYTLLQDNKQVYKVTRWLIWAMVNDCIRRNNYKNGTDEKEIPEWVIGDLLTFNRMEEILDSINGSIVDSTPRADQDAPVSTTP